MMEFLYREFCNHVYLGQWELARSCALALIKTNSPDENSRQLLLSTLQNIAKNPHLVRSAWTTVACPSCFSFLSCQLLLDVISQDEVKTWRRQADFNILLETFLKGSKTALMELSSIHSHLLRIKDEVSQSKISDFNFEISSESISSLRNAFAENPVAISKLLNMMHIPKYLNIEGNLNFVICDIHFSHLLKCLKSVKSKFMKSNKSQGLTDFVSNIYFLLSILPECTLDVNRRTNIDEVLIHILQLCKSRILDLPRVYQSLLSQLTPRLYHYFCNFQEQKLDVNIREDINYTEEFPKCYTSDGSFSHQNALLSSVNSSAHFLQELMEISIKNILEGSWAKVQNILNDPLLHLLKPLLLIFSWSNCQDDLSALNVIQAVKNWNGDCYDTILVEACQQFKLNASLTDLCINFYRNLYPDAKQSEINSKTRSILSNLQTQSALRVVNLMFGLKNVPPDKMKEMLHFTQGDSPSEFSLHTADKAVYSGYLALSLIIESIHLSCEYKNLLFVKKINLPNLLHTNRKVFKESTSEETDSESEKTKESLSDYIDNHGPQKAYARFILNRLKKAKKEIKAIFPVSFRVEILENIFSLLFSMSNVLGDSLEPCSDSDEGHEGEMSITPTEIDHMSTQNDTTQSSESEKIFSGRFVISTVKLKDSSESRFSGRLSTESNSSSALQSYTFLCNEFITQDILSLLKDLVMEANAEVYQVIGQSDITLKNKISFERSEFKENWAEESISSFSISSIQLRERSSQLLKYVNEALWRYEVVKSGIFQGTFAMSPLQKKKPYLFQSQLSASSSDGTDGESKKRRKKKKQKRSFSNLKKESFAESSIIQCMLSSPEALLRYSLWSRNLMQAAQVIKLFHLEASSEAKEVVLIQELQRISTKLAENEKMKKKLQRRNSAFVPEAKSLLSNIQAIEDAAASGLRSSEICLIVHKELSSLKVPELIDITDGVKHPELLLGSKNIYSIFLADLGCTSGVSLDLSSVLLEMASRTWSDPKEKPQDLDAKVLSRKKMPLIRGVFRTLSMMNSLLTEFLSFCETDGHEDLKPLFWPLNKSFNSFSPVLSNFIGNLDCQRFKEEINSWKQTSYLLKEFIDLMKEEEINEKSGILQKDITRENKLHMMYKNLSKVLRELRDWSSETIRPQQVRYDNYLSKLLVHLHQVTLAVLDCKKQSSETDSVIYTSDFSILKESPVELLKKIILQSGVTPEKIEKFAVRMKVDLVHVLAQACLPHVPLLDKSASSYKLMQSICCINKNGSPSLILNKSKGEWINPRHPDVVAKELLRDIIAMIQDTTIANDSCGIFTVEELFSLTQHSELSSWMEECSELAFVDLDLLKSREEKLAFFVNLTNIAWLHAILLEAISFQSQEKENAFPSNHAETNVFTASSNPHFQLISPNTLERLAMQKVLGYCVGQLGPISLFDLRYQLLHAQRQTPKHLQDSPFCHLLGDHKTVWEMYAPPLEPRVLFVLVEGLMCSPRLQAMYSDSIDYQLEEAMKDYFDFTITIDLQRELVSLPKLLEWYATDFSYDAESDSNNAPYEGLLNLISTSVGSNLANSFSILFSADSVHNFSENIDASGKKQLPFLLEFEPPLLSCGIMLGYTDRNILPLLNNSTNASPIMDTQPFVIKYLQEKCPILNDLYEIFRNTQTSQDLSSESLCLETSAQKLFSTEESYSKVPVTQLLIYYKNLLVPTEDGYSWFSSALSSSPDKSFLSHQIGACFAKNEWHKALIFVDMYLECCENDETYILLRKLILEHLISINELKCAMDPCSFAICIKNPVYRANTVLQNVKKWEDNSAIQALKFCLSDQRLINYPEIHNSLSTKLKEVLLYKQIFDFSEKFGDSEVKDCNYVFNNWQEVAECSVWAQSRILDFIRATKKYDLSVQWSELHVIDKEERMLALSMSIIWYLTQDPLQELEVFQIIESFEDPSECLTLCDMVLSELLSVEAKLCLVQYIVDNNMSEDKKHYYFNLSLGLKMLSALRSPTKESYSDLAAHPYILLEQMLMNVELRDAELALKAIYDDLKGQTDIIPVLTLSSVNQLIEDYASKALEVHFLDALLDDSSSSTLVLSTDEILVSDEPFMMPLRVPTKDEWVPDAKIQRCQVCKEERFNMFSRRHHCRRCGRVVCANCSQHALIVEGYGNVKVRVCDDCYNAMTGSLSLTTASFEKRYRVLSSMRSSSPRNSPYQIENLGLRRRSSSTHMNQQAFRWVLSSDSEQNASVRNEFSYEQTPSISLCYSILKLHTDDKKCAQFLMHLSDRLLGKIKMRRSGKLPLEVDYSLIISMMKSLLLNAKMKCQQVQDNEGEALAALYFQHLDVIKLLVNANCRHLIPREALTGSDTARKLRDKLLEEERMHLALEVSTKFNLEKTGVWSSWGLLCLKAGDWPTARLKFQQCLKVVNDKNDQAKENPLLNKILKVLETSKYPGTEKAAAIFKSLQSLSNIKHGLSQFETEVSPLDDLIKKECLFYLKMYGTHFDAVEFYHRHGLFGEALDYIIEKKCEPEIFIEALFMPVLKNVQLSTLKHLITVTDPSLTVLSTYLFGTCRYLEHFHYLTVLYEMQIFMEDYARAAKSAINFYLAPAPSYTMMFERQRHLHNAKKHYEKYLEFCKGTDDVSELWRRRKNIKNLSVKEVESYIQLITLQEGVSQFLKRCESQGNSSFLYEGDFSKDRHSRCPPTLFGNSQMKSEVVSMVLINAVNVDDGFDLAKKILKTFNLDASSILSTAGKNLVKLRQKHQIPHYLTCVKCVFDKMVKVDDIILDCVSEISKQGGEVEDIIKMLTSESNKINAYLICGKLKSAYLLAIKLNSALDVRRIMIAAEQCGQESIQSICKKWLETKSLKLKTKESVAFQ